MKLIAASFILFMAACFFSCNNSKKTIVLNQQQDSLVVDSSCIEIDATQIKRIEPTLIQNTEDVGWKFENLWADSTIYPHGDTVKAGFRFQVSLMYPILAPKSNNLSAIQKAFVQIISKDDAINIEQAFDRQVAKNIVLAKSVDEELDEVSIINYDQSYSIAAQYISKSIVIAEVFESAYRGGAHNIFHTHFYNISTNNGDIISEERFFKSGYKPQLAKLIQNEIDRQNSCTDEQEHLNLLIDLSDLNPNNNFYLENTGITYVYNVYEITGFADGVIEIHLPYETIKSLVKDAYLPLVLSLQKEQIFTFKSITSEDGILKREQ